MQELGKKEGEKVFAKKINTSRLPLHYIGARTGMSGLTELPNLAPSIF